MAKLSSVGGTSLSPPKVLALKSLRIQRFIQDFFGRGGGGGEGKHWPLALSQTLLCVIEMFVFHEMY